MPVVTGKVGPGGGGGGGACLHHCEERIACISAVTVKVYNMSVWGGGGGGLNNLKFNYKMYNFDC